MPTTSDVIVAGLGSMGAAACHYLARDGARVIGLDARNVPNPQASYHGDTRVIRLSYQEHPDYVPLLQEAYRLWSEFEEHRGIRLLHPSGILYLGYPNGPSLTGVRRASDRHQLDHTLLTHDEVRRSYPQFSLPEAMVGIVEPKGGYLLSELAVATFVAAALEQGASLRSNEPVLSWERIAGGIRVRTTRETYEAGCLLLTAGAWSQPLLKLPEVALTVTRQVLGWVWPRRPDPFRAGNFPVWLIDPEPGQQPAGLHYGFPMPSGEGQGVGLKSGWHFPSTPMAADAITAETTDRDREEVLNPLRRYLPDAAGELLALKVCRYTNSADGHFIVDRHPEVENVYFACGFSGHGFKFASVMGRVLADWALRGATRQPVAFLGLNRFVD